MQPTVRHFSSAVQPAASYFRVFNDNTQTHRCHCEYLPREIWSKGNASGDLRNLFISGRSCGAVWSMVTGQNDRGRLDLVSVPQQGTHIPVNPIDSLQLGWPSAQGGAGITVALLMDMLRLSSCLLNPMFVVTELRCQSVWLQNTDFQAWRGSSRLKLRAAVITNLASAQGYWAYRSILSIKEERFTGFTLPWGFMRVNG